jgi:hypothetical protein
MAKRRTTTQWPKEKAQKDQQRSGMDTFYSFRVNPSMIFLLNLRCMFA